MNKFESFGLSSLNLPLELATFSPIVEQGDYLRLGVFWLDASSFHASDRTYKIFRVEDGKLVELKMHITDTSELRNILTSVFTRCGKKLWESTTSVWMPTNPETLAGRSMEIFCLLTGLRNREAPQENFPLEITVECFRKELDAL